MYEDEQFVLMATDRLIVTPLLTLWTISHTDAILSGIVSNQLWSRNTLRALDAWCKLRVLMYGKIKNDLGILGSATEVNFLTMDTWQEISFSLLLLYACLNWQFHILHYKLQNNFLHKLTLY